MTLVVLVFFSRSRAPLTNYAEEAIAVFVADFLLVFITFAMAGTLQQLFADTHKVPSFLAGVFGMVPYF